MQLFIHARIILKLILQVGISNKFCEIGRRWVPHNSIGDKSTSVQIKAWYRQATHHYLNQR